LAPRGYLQRRRADSAVETRRRIVAATFALHGEQGIAATSMKQIARRAGVSIGTVYYHFPTYDDCIAACRDFTFAELPPPRADALFGSASLRRERVERLAHAWFGYYARMPNIEKIRSDRDVFAVIDEAMRNLEQIASELAAAAISTTADDPRVGAIAAALDPAVFSALLRRGFTVESAADTAAAMLNAWLDQEPGSLSTGA
jgi:AcrR family transcriptional regulator